MTGSVHPLHGSGNGGVTLGQGEEGDVAQPAGMYD
jgi:hypothetical protein